MESRVVELGDLKYSIALEISLEEIKPTYDSVFKQLKKTRLNGFAQGNTPKDGWKSVLSQQCIKKQLNV